MTEDEFNTAMRAFDKKLMISVKKTRKSFNRYLKRDYLRQQRVIAWRKKWAA